MMEGDTGSRNQERMDKTITLVAGGHSTSTTSSVNSRSTICLNLQMNIRPNSSFSDVSINEMMQPVQVKVEYPEDLHVNVSAVIQRSDKDGIPASPGIKTLKDTGTGMDRISSNTETQTRGYGNVRFSESNLDMNKDKLEKKGKYKKSSKGYDGQRQAEFDMPTSGGEDGDCTIYHSMNNEEDSLTGRALFGNDQFGNLSVISPSASDMLSTNVNVGSMADLGVTDFGEEEGDGDCPDGELYPNLSDMEEEEGVELEKQEENKKDSSKGVDVVTDKTFLLPSAEETDEEAVKGLMQEILDKVDPNSPPKAHDMASRPTQSKGKKVFRKTLTSVPAPSAVASTSGACGFNVGLPMKSGKKKMFSASLEFPVRPTPGRHHHQGGRFEKVEMTLLKGVEGEEEEANDSEKENVLPLPPKVPRRYEVPLKSASATAFDLKRRSSTMETGRSFKWIQEGCEHGHQHQKAGDVHTCHICVPIPEEAVGLLENSIGLTATEARKSAFTLLRYLREHQHTDGVKTLMKYISGTAVSCNKPSKYKIAQPAVQNKEQKFRFLLNAVTRQKGAWGIFEDEEVVVAHLEELNQLLTTLDRTGIRKSLREDRYQSVKGLCVYFALEKRWPIRQELLSSLDLLAANDSTSLALLMASDLPVDLANIIRQEYMTNDGGQGIIIAVANVLLALLRTGMRLQVDHFKKLDSKFVFVLLGLSEGNLKDGCSTELKDLAVGLVLAYNLQFRGDELYRNHVIGAISGFGEAEYLKQKMLHFILNKEVKKFGSTPHSFPSGWCHMVVKLGLDILMCSGTSDFFIDADLNIMLAGLPSFISELDVGDEKRTGALQLTRVILRRLDYQHNGLRRVIQTVKGILNEKEVESRRDQKIARKIAKEIDEGRQLTQF